VTDVGQEARLHRESEHRREQRGLFHRRWTDKTCRQLPYWSTAGIRYRLTDCRLRHVDSAGRLSQALVVDGRDEVPEMSEFHGTFDVTKCDQLHHLIEIAANFAL
jgi:hypothetical protein